MIAMTAERNWWRAGTAFSRALSWMLATVAVLALVFSWSGLASPTEMLGGALDSLGPFFLIVASVLTLIALAALVRVQEAQDGGDLAFWRDAGLHAASGIATAALTCTLFGISLGIGSLARTELTPETVNAVIAELTGYFGLAFMTTVVGLPLAAALRAILGLAAAGRRRFLQVPH